MTLLSRIQLFKTQEILLLAIFSFLIFIVIPILEFSTPLAHADCNWSGEWDITYDSSYQDTTYRAVFEQNGAQLIVGGETWKVSGDTARIPSCTIVNGECVRPGHYVMIISADCNSFSGYCEFEDKGECATTFTGTRVGSPNKPDRYVIAPGLQEGEGGPWGSVYKVFIDGQEVTDCERPSLYNGSQIKTGPGVEILIRSANGAQTRVTENTQYEVKVVEHSGATRTEVYGRLFKGICNFYWPPGQEGYRRFQVDTKRAKTSIKGTTFTQSETEDLSTIEVEEGVVEVTHLDTCEVSTVKAGETLVIEDSCRYVGEDLSIPISCARYLGISYGFTFQFYVNPSDPGGLYWKLNDAYTLFDGIESECISVGENLSIPICCAEYGGIKYSFVLDFYDNPNDTSGLYWKLDLTTFKIAERLGEMEIK